MSADGMTKRSSHSLSDPSALSHALVKPRVAGTEEAQRALEYFEEQSGLRLSAEARALVALVAEHAPAMFPLLRNDPPLVRDLLRRPLTEHPGRNSMRGRLKRSLKVVRERQGAATSQFEFIGRVLRRFRHRELLRIAMREVLRLADIDHTSREISWVAELCVEEALRAARAHAEQRFGPAQRPSGQAVPLVCLGMGKLGGCELNLGSDIDLCFFYGTDDAAVRDGDITVHEFFSRIVQDTTRLLSDVTDDGFCFRVDLRLRPEGSSGPLVNSLGSAERYYETWGRTWERAALLRARAVAGERAFGQRLLQALRPFVYTRRVDPTVANRLGDLLLQSRREMKVDLERDVKLGAGGIREVEFFVQALQLIWGGRHPKLQAPGTLLALARLQAEGFVSDGEAHTLSDDWALLRRVEHRIHMRSGYQTHSIPASEQELGLLARSLGYPSPDALVADLDDARQRVGQLFASLREQQGDSELDELFGELCDQAAGAEEGWLATKLGEVLPVMDAHEAAAYVRMLARRADSPLGPISRERLRLLGPLIMSEVAGVPNADAALGFFADFFVQTRSPQIYGRLLVRRPRLVRRMAGLFGTSARLSRALIAHPEDADLLLLGLIPDEVAVSAAHEEASQMIDDALGGDDVLGALRRAKRTLTLQVGLAALSGELSVDAYTRLITTVAETQVALCVRLAERELARRMPAPSADFVVCALGKLGGRELGFAGDLDLLFLYVPRTSDEVPGVAQHEYFARLSQRTLSLLSQMHPEGVGYRTDLRLRPNGEQGSLVASLEAFEHYHQQRAAFWERQLLIRARPIVGPAHVQQHVSDRLQYWAYRNHDPNVVELARIRRRMQQELSGETAARAHLKLGFGGLVDLEFAIQVLQMKHGDLASVRTPHTPTALQSLREAHVVDAMRPIRCSRRMSSTVSSYRSSRCSGRAQNLT